MAAARRLVPALLRETEFRRFWTAETVSLFGDQVTALALPVVAVLALGAEATQMGLLVAAGLLPNLLFSLPVGVWLDRVRDRRKVMILMDLGRAGLIAAIPLGFYLNMLNLPLLFAIFFLVGSLSVVFDIASNTVFVALARRDQFVEAGQLMNGSRSLASVGGPALAGVLIELVKAPLALLADALSFVGSAVFLSRIRVAEAPVEHDPGSIRSQLATGLAFLARDPIIRPSVLSVATMNLFNYCFQGLFVLYVLKYLGVDPGVLGLALGVGAIGSVLGAIVSARVGRRFGVGRAWIIGLIVFPAATILVPVAAPGMPMPAILGLLFAAEFFSGLGVMILDINGGAMLFARTPDRIRGRANGAFRFVNMGVRPIGAVLGGVLGGLFGVREVLFLVTFAQLSGVLWLIGSPLVGLRELPDAAE